ncbi:MAG TPA: L,D-transpeptidase family protein [Terracidiphilus sp.]|nr:L,D-transpeptidase family protein [Terracidiphilus sp.]
MIKFSMSNLKAAVRFVSLAAALCLLACSSTDATKVSSTALKADRILVVKSSHTMTLMTHGRILNSYKVALGRGGSGPKVRAGDNKTPEGDYVIDQKIVKSRFHLALHISYPNESDKARAVKTGVDPGGAIEIHGLPKGLGWLGPIQHEVDWTEGCIAVSNPEIEEISRLVPVGTQIEIKP